MWTRHQYAELRRALEARFGDRIEGVLQILLVGEGDAEVGLIPIEHPDEGSSLIVQSPPDKVRAEIHRWIAILRDPNRGLRTYSVPLADLAKAHHPEAALIFERTRRMLLFLEALLLPSLEVAPTALERLAAQLRSEIPELDRAIQRVLISRIVLEQTPKLHTSLALLLVVAVGHSQCLHYLPHFWEAYSAGRARDELSRKWAGLPRAVHRDLLDVISFLIRYQSAPGQMARGTGPDGFRLRAEQLARSGRISEVDLLDVIRIVGVLEEARNRQLPLTTMARVEADGGVHDWDAPSGFVLFEDETSTLPMSKESRRIITGVMFRTRDELEAELRVHLDAHHDQIPALVARAHMTPRRTAQLIFSSRRGADITWSYFRLLNVSTQELGAFKKVILDHIRRLYPVVPIEAVSLGRFQVESLRQILSEAVQAVVRRKAALETLFRVVRRRVPDMFGATTLHEEFFDVLLEDHLAAQALLFRADFTEAGRHPAPADASAGALFAYLFQLGIQRFDLSTHRLTDRQQHYLPYPLIRRYLDIVYSLRPASCVSILLTFDRDERVSIPVPLGLRSRVDEEAIDAVAGFVHATILNRAMSVGLRSCDMGFDNFHLTEHPELPEGALSASEWRARVQRAHTSYGYPTLLETYLGIYNTERRCVEMRDASVPQTLSPTPVRRLVELLRRVDLGEARHFLGIDVGGTFVKIGLYTGDLQGLIMPIFRIPTRSGGAPAPEGERAASALAAFAYRVLDEVRRRLPPAVDSRAVAAVGISWPGPVRANRIAGTSGILGNFPPLKGTPHINSFNELIAFDVVKAFREAWGQVFYRSPGGGPYMALINDGNADATGAVVDRAQSTPDAAQDRLVVVKLGTGTAGGAFWDGRLTEGPTEWGKIVLDLGAPPDATFPSGVTNPYLSARTLPRLTGRDRTRLPPIEGLLSSELGYILECASTTPGSGDVDRKPFDRAWFGFGLTAVAVRSWSAGVDSTTLEQAAKGECDPERLDVIAAQLGVLGDQVVDTLNRLIVVEGGHRLARLLGIRTEDLARMHADPGLMPAPVDAALRRVLELVSEAVATLGTYLGDFLVLLHDLYGMSEVIVGGGVLSRVTGERVIAAAIRRARAYGLEVAIGDPDRRRDGIVEHATTASGRRSPTLTLWRSDPERDLGPLGAAAAAAGEALYRRKQDGLNAIRAEIQRFAPGDRVELSDNQVQFRSAVRGREVPLAEFGLERKEVSDFLEAEGAVLGVFCTGDSDLYTKWSSMVFARPLPSDLHRGLPRPPGPEAARVGAARIAIDIPPSGSVGGRTADVRIRRSELARVHLHLAFPEQRNRTAFYLRRHVVGDESGAVGPNAPMRNEADPPKLTIPDHIEQMRNSGAIAAPTEPRTLGVDRVMEEPTLLAVPISDLVANLLRPSFHRDGLGAKRVFHLADEPISRTDYFCVCFFADEGTGERPVRRGLEFRWLRFDTATDRVVDAGGRDLLDAGLVWAAAVVPLLVDGRPQPAIDIARYNYDLRQIIGREAEAEIRYAYEGWFDTWSRRVSEVVSRHDSVGRPYASFYHSILGLDLDGDVRLVQRDGTLPDIARELADEGLVAAGLLDSGGSCALYDPWTGAYLNHNWYFRERRGAVLVFELAGRERLPDNRPGAWIQRRSR